MHLISGVDYCYTHKFACLSITRKILLDIDAPSGRNNPSVTRHQSIERRGLWHGNIVRPAFTMTHSRHGKEIAQLVAVRMSTWQWISEGGGNERGWFRWRRDAKALYPIRGSGNARGGRGKHDAGVGNPTIPCGIWQNGEPSPLPLLPSEKIGIE
jgi:hypothetical protein